MSISAVNTVPAPVRTAKAAAPAPTPLKGALDSYQKAATAKPATTTSQWALWSAGATLAAGVVLGVLGRPGMAIACVLSAAVDGAVQLGTAFAVTTELPRNPPHGSRGLDR